MKRKRDCLGLTALITGATRGIGLEYSFQLAARGANIVFVSNEEERLEIMREGLSINNPRQKFYACCKDLTEPDCADYLLDFCEKHDVEIDILINNAGIFEFREVCDMSSDKLNSFIDLHIRAVTLISRAFLPQMKRRGDGYILNMSSMSCWMAMPGIAMYSATKSYIQVFSKALYLETKDSGVSVTVACPGGIATDLFGLPENLKRFAVRIGVLTTPEKFVHAALKQMFKRKQQYVNGFINKIAVFVVPKLPVWVKMLVKRKLLDNRRRV